MVAQISESTNTNTYHLGHATSKVEFHDSFQTSMHLYRPIPIFKSQHRFRPSYNSPMIWHISVNSFCIHGNLVPFALPYIHPLPTKNCLAVWKKCKFAKLESNTCSTYSIPNLIFPTWRRRYWSMLEARKVTFPNNSDCSTKYLAACFGQGLNWYTRPSCR